ncbi:hypothetical protein KQI77_09575 [Clostridium sp. MSJ-8]|uniref:DUF6115 domain-containing protein n=1 Tax=Clostridium sp. MSJ-8 TaxID=2841510 RepID=UPI001C0EF2D7|nr:hypothetical protein [Clostridium sp. MSJ-8]MBU5488380.1 hypothetical protein [Clostridium sp. MSJ-8]
MPVVIIFFGICLIIVNIISIKKEKRPFNSVLKYKEENMTEVNLELAALRKDFAETILELQTDIVELKKRIDILEGKETIAIQNSEQEPILNSSKDINVKDDVINDINMDSKSNRIKELIDLGLSDDEICEKLSLGKGEVLLVRNLYK